MPARSDNRIDVIIPTRNRPTLTVDAVRAVQAQTFPDWRCWVVDDASEDDTPDRIEQVAALDDRITVIRRTTRGGSNPARQTGLAASDAGLVAICDSDDLWEPTKLERQVARWDRLQADGEVAGPIVCWHDAVDAQCQRRGEVMRPRAGRRWHPFIAFNTSTPLVARTTLEEAGGFAPSEPYTPRTTDHIDLFLRLTRRHPIVTVPEVLVHCRHHPGARNSDQQRTGASADEAALLLEEWDDELRSRPETRAWLFATVAGRYLDIGEVRRAIPYLRVALQADGTRTAAHIAGHYAPLFVRLLDQRRSHR